MSLQFVVPSTEKFTSNHAVLLRTLSNNTDSFEQCIKEQVVAPSIGADGWYTHCNVDLHFFQDEDDNVMDIYAYRIFQTADTAFAETDTSVFVKIIAPIYNGRKIV